MLKILQQRVDGSHTSPNPVACGLWHKYVPMTILSSLGADRKINLNEFSLAGWLISLFITPEYILLSKYPYSTKAPLFWHLIISLQLPWKPFGKKPEAKNVLPFNTVNSCMTQRWVAFNKPTHWCETESCCHTETTERFLTKAFIRLTLK